jgi:hypothetical protein
MTVEHTFQTTAKECIEHLATMTYRPSRLPVHFSSDLRAILQHYLLMGRDLKGRYEWYLQTSEKAIEYINNHKHLLS